MLWTSYIDFLLIYVGTGKTTCARKMSAMFHALGLLPGDGMFEAKASDLVTGYTGQAGKCTREILRKSLGGVLFIDEAYQLDPARGGTYMIEAVDELVGALTEEEFMGKLIVILAGYNADMENMLKTNPGLKSRFSERVQFDDFDAGTVSDLLVMQLRKDGIPLCGLDTMKLNMLAKQLINESGDSFGNGRDVVTWSKKVYEVVANKFSQDTHVHGDYSFSSSLEDVSVALEQMLESRRAREGGQACTFIDRSVDKTQEAVTSKDPPPVRQSIQAVNMNANEAEVAEELATSEQDSSADLPPNIFDELSPDVLKSLQAYIDENGLGSEDGVKHLAAIKPGSQEFIELANRLAKDTGISFAEATDKLTKWQGLQEELEAIIEKEKQKSKIVGTRPIWRCAVCGRADKPWIECYVAPFIVGYENVDIGGLAG